MKSTNEEIFVQMLDGILMVIPRSKQINVNAYKYFKKSISPNITLEPLPIKIINDNLNDLNIQSIANEENEIYDLTESDENVNHFGVESETLNGHSSYNYESVNEDVGDYSNDDLITNDVLTIKLEPKVELEEMDFIPPNNNKKVKKKKLSIQKFIKVLKIKNRKDGVIYFCKLCSFNEKKRYRLVQHIKNVHIPEPIKKNQDSFFTVEEKEFLKANLKVLRRSWICKICEQQGKHRDSGYIHMLNHHMNKSHHDVFGRYLLNSICRKGEVKNNIFKCVVCHEKDNPITFNKKRTLMVHLKMHAKSELRSCIA